MVDRLTGQHPHPCCPAAVPCKDKSSSALESAATNPAPPTPLPPSHSPPVAAGASEEEDRDAESALEEPVLLEDMSLEAWPEEEGPGAGDGTSAATPQPATPAASAGGGRGAGAAPQPGPAAAAAPSEAVRKLMAEMAADGSDQDAELAAQIAAEMATDSSDGEAAQEAGGLEADSVAELQEAAAELAAAAQKLEQLAEAADARPLGHSGIPAIAAAAKALQGAAPPSKHLLWGVLESLAMQQQELRAELAVAKVGRRH